MELGNCCKIRDDQVRRSIQGHPQCLKKTTTVGLPSAAGSISFGAFGARVPITGAGATSIIAGGGFAHDFQAFGTSMWEKVLAHDSPSGFAPFLEDEGFLSLEL
jgi:hypothetical protein